MNWEYPTASFPLSERAAVQPQDRVHFSSPAECAACEEVKPITEHHLIPREMKSKDRRTIPLCWGCHTEIHYLPNSQIATMSEAQQLAYIKAARQPAQSIA